MLKRIPKEIIIALLGIIALVMFVFGYNYLKGSALFSSTTKITAEYDNVQGLLASNYVQIQGMNVGSVKSIEFSKTNPGRITVTMEVREDLKIPTDSKAKIVSLDLLGTKAISITPGSSSTFLKSNQSIAGELELGTIESLGASAGPAIDNIKTTISSLDQTVHSINNILDAGTQQELKSSISGLNSTMKNFTQLSTELNNQRQKISSLLNNLNEFADNLNKNNGTINKVLTNAETTTQKLSKLDLESTLSELKTTLDGMQSTLDKVNNGKGSLALLMNDDKLYKNLKNTLSTANNLLYDINARPSRYINVNLIGRKQKNECPPAQAPNSNE